MTTIAMFFEFLKETPRTTGDETIVQNRVEGWTVILEKFPSDLIEHRTGNKLGHFNTRLTRVPHTAAGSVAGAVPARSGLFPGSVTQQ